MGEFYEALYYLKRYKGSKKDLFKIYIDLNFKTKQNSLNFTEKEIASFLDLFLDKKNYYIMNCIKKSH